MVRVAIYVKASTSTPEGPIVNEAVVEGGGLASASVSSQSTISANPAFEIANLTIQPTEGYTLEKIEEEGEHLYKMVNEPYKQPFTQAGGHPWALTTKFEFATETRDGSKSGTIESGTMARRILFQCMIRRT